MGTEAGSFRKLGRKSLGRMEDRELELRKKRNRGIMELRPKSMMGHWAELCVLISLASEPLSGLLCPDGTEQLCTALLLWRNHGDMFPWAASQPSWSACLSWLCPSPQSSHMELDTQGHLPVYPCTQNTRTSLGSPALSF